MSFIDLFLAGVIALSIRVYKRIHWERCWPGLVKNIAAFLLALLLHPYAASLISTTGLPARMANSLDVVLTLPAGPGTEFARALMWLSEASLPEVLATAIREAWQRDITADVEALTQAARGVVAKAIVNLLCFIAAFVTVRWLFNLASATVIKILPPALARGNRALCVALSLTQSVLVCAILVAILAPLAITTAIPPFLIEHYRHSFAADMFLRLLNYLDLYRL